MPAPAACTNRPYTARRRRRIRRTANHETLSLNELEPDTTYHYRIHRQQQLSGKPAAPNTHVTTPKPSSAFALPDQPRLRARHPRRQRAPHLWKLSRWRGRCHPRVSERRKARLCRGWSTRRKRRRQSQSRTTTGRGHPRAYALGEPGHRHPQYASKGVDVWCRTRVPVLHTGSRVCAGRTSRVRTDGRTASGSRRHRSDLYVRDGATGTFIPVVTSGTPHRAPNSGGHVHFLGQRLISGTSWSRQKSRCSAPNRYQASTSGGKGR